MNIATAAPEAYKAMYALEKFLNESTLPKTLKELVSLRVSQINGCAFCVDMHAHDLRAGGETDERLFSVPTWREAPFYTDQERAAFRLAEEATVLGREGVSDEAWAEAKAHFDDETLAALIVEIATINAWNRYNIIVRTPPGILRKGQVKASA